MRHCRLPFALAPLAALVISACTPSSNGDSAVTLTGNAVAGAVNGTVQVLDPSGSPLAQGSVSNGSFSVSLPSSALGGELDFIVTGSYVDESSGDTVTLTSAHPLALRAEAGELEGDQRLGITPATTVIRQMAAHHNLSLTTAKGRFESIFGYTPNTHLRPFDPTQAIPAEATDGDKGESFRVGSFSQWANGLGLRNGDIGALPTALAHDIADGVCDGKEGGQPVLVGGVDLDARHREDPLPARYLAAMASFSTAAANSGHLVAPTMGLPGSNALDVISPSSTTERIVTLANGTRVHARISLNRAAPFPMSPATAKSVHRITLLDDNGNPIDVGAVGSPVSDLQASAYMHMLSGMGHTTPMVATYDPVTSIPAQGIYDFTVYYVMASSMMSNGMSMPMGLWDFKITLNAATPTPSAVLFHPNVTMPMGGSALSASVRDTTDMVVSMGTSSPRSYKVWLDDVVAAGGGHSLRLFVSTKVGMTFPAVYAPATLASGMMGSDTLTLTTVTVNVSTDGGATWQLLAPTGSNGYYGANITGLAAGSNTLTVQLTVNGNTLKTSGNVDPSLTFNL